MVRLHHSKQEKLARRKGRSSRALFEEDDLVRVQCPLSKRWDKQGTIVKKRISDEGQQTSFEVRMEGGGLSVRHKQHLRHAVRSTERVSVKKVSFGGEEIMGEGRTFLGTAAEVRSNSLPPRTRSRTRLQREAASE